jgi:4a-hydroxytetrahydrobiopterin dehydratase
MAELLSDAAVERQLPDGWNREGEEIVRTYEFDDYLTGVSFAATVGEISEEEWHHPAIEIRYGEVEVHLTSHEEGGITDQDIHMAELFDDAR